VISAAALRQQLIVLQRKVRGRVRFTNTDRLFFIQLYRWFPSVFKAITIVRPETLVRWHRAGFSPLLALQISKPGRTPANQCRFASIDPRNALLTLQRPIWTRERTPELDSSRATPPSYSTSKRLDRRFVIAKPCRQHMAVYSGSRFLAFSHEQPVKPPGPSCSTQTYKVPSECGGQASINIVRC
jgi:hypothetical protein